VARRGVVLLCALLFVAGCGSGPPASPGGSSSGSGAPSTAPPSIATPGAATTPPATQAPTSVPSPYPVAALPVRGQTIMAGAELLLAPAPDGALYVVIPGEDGAVLARLDESGAPTPGWPVALPHTTRCDFLGAAADGSVRAICDATDIDQPEWCCDTVRAFALDADGRPLHGWPVEIDITDVARIVGDDLLVLSDLPVTDLEEIGRVTTKARLSRIGPDGVVVAGVEVPIVYRGGWESWAIGPDGVAYATSTLYEDDPQPDQILAIDLEGSVDGWPVRLPGRASPPALATDGRVLVLDGTLFEPPIHVMAVDPADVSRVAVSTPLPIELAYEVDCGDPPLGRAPLSRGGVTVVRDGLTFYALDPSLQLLPGWPYEAPDWFQEWVYPNPDGGDGLDCGVYAAPVLGPDGTLFLPLSAESDSTGGSVVAIGRNGKDVAGWPVTVRRSGSGFWWVEVGQDGTVFAVAVERETGGLSATIVALAPDSTVLWRATVVEP
jgi:hypothetical protein